MWTTKTFKTLILLFAISFSFISCNNDDDDSTVTPNGILRIDISQNNPSRYDLYKGFIIHPNDSYYEEYDIGSFYLAFTDGDITLINNELKFSENTTFLASFKLGTTSDYGPFLENGRYSINGTDNKYIADYYAVNNVQVENGDIVSGESTDFFSNGITPGGFIDFYLENDIYDIEITINLLENYTQLSGNYSGELIVLE